MKLLPLFEYIVKSNLKGRKLYFHSSPVASAIDILYTNSIRALTDQVIQTKLSPSNPNHGISDEGQGMYRGVSFTRDWQFQYGAIQFILDGDLLKRDYGKKLVPFDYYNDYSSHKIFRDASLNEYEEFLIGELKNLNKYLLGIRTVEESEFESGILDDSVTLLKFQNAIKTLNIPVYNFKFQDITQQVLAPQQQLQDK